MTYLSGIQSALTGGDTYNQPVFDDTAGQGRVQTHWLFFNRLAVWTSRSIVWPAEVAAAVGSDVAAPQSAARAP